MRAKMAAAFAMGCAFGALCLAVGLWRSGALIPAGRRHETAAPAGVNLPAPREQSLSDLMADLGKQAPPPPVPPAEEPFQFSEAPAGAASGTPPPRSPAATGTPPPQSPAATGTPPPQSPAASGTPSGPIGPRPPVSQGESDRIAPDRTGLPHLAMPLSGINPKKLTDNFSDRRDGRKHEALDIMAPRGTPVRAVAEGNVAKLFTSKQGGLTVYQFDNSRTWCYYYAHLDRYATGLKDGTLLRVGDVLGYVGSTGDAWAKAPHLHFAVFKMGPEKKWWVGTAIDPLPLFQ